jgi:hypothetical protein
VHKQSKTSGTEKAYKSWNLSHHSVQERMTYCQMCRKENLQTLSKDVNNIRKAEN